MLHIGCHLSSSKGFLAMGRTALSLGANTFQFFTRNPRGSRARAMDPAAAAALRQLVSLRCPPGSPSMWMDSRWRWRHTTSMVPTM